MRGAHTRANSVQRRMYFVRSFFAAIHPNTNVHIQTERSSLPNSNVMVCECVCAFTTYIRLFAIVTQCLSVGPFTFGSWRATIFWEYVHTTASDAYVMVLARENPLLPLIPFRSLSARSSAGWHRVRSLRLTYTHKTPELTLFDIMFWCGSAVRFQSCVNVFH